jgi:hypothetical protein
VSFEVSQQLNAFEALTRPEESTSISLEKPVWSVYKVVFFVEPKASLVLATVELRLLSG